MVEDEHRVRNNAVRMLQSAGFSVTVVENAELALEEIAKSRFNLIFSDIVMPGKLDGKEFADLVSTLYPDIPVQLTSGFDKNLNNGPNEDRDILPKPYSKAQLMDKISPLLTRNYNKLRNKISAT